MSSWTHKIYIPPLGMTRNKQHNVCCLIGWTVKMQQINRSTNWANGFILPFILKIHEIINFHCIATFSVTRIKIYQQVERRLWITFTSSGYYNYLQYRNMSQAINCNQRVSTLLPYRHNRRIAHSILWKHLSDWPRVNPSKWLQLTLWRSDICKVTSSFCGKVQ